MSNKTTRNRFRRRAGRALSACLFAGAGILGPQAAMAQAEAQGASVNEIEEVFVTARRRSESLQEVPIAVSSLGGDVVREQNRNSVPDLITLIPAITLRPQNSAKDTVLLIRGLGTITTSPGAEPSVSMVLDGVVLARPGQMVSELVDLERIEVLRGRRASSTSSRRTPRPTSTPSSRPAIMAATSIASLWGSTARSSRAC
jgi:iron complex outermembrane receptor protein